MINGGLNYGIDFTGGYEATLDLGENVTQEIADDIKNIITAEKTLGADYAGSITYSETSVKIESKSEMTAEQQNKLVELICEKYTKASHEVDISNVSAVIGSKMLVNALLAVGIAAVLMLVYIAFRFEVASGLAAVCCLLHDLFVMLVFYSLLQMPITTSVIAAFLTILGYSINATIVVFDRIRENRKKLDGTAFGDVVNVSIHETMGRSVNTTITTLLTIGAIFGACAITVIVSPTSNLDGLRDFAATLIIGIGAGLFSSVALSGLLWNAFSGIFGKKTNKK